MTHPDPWRPHLLPEFRDRFPTWSDLTSAVAQQASGPEFDSSRAMQQLIMTDLLAGLNQRSHEWHLLGSLALPVRPHPDDTWPATMRPSQAGPHPAYCMPRTAFDLDLFAHSLRHRDAHDYGHEVLAAIHDIAPAISQPGRTSTAGLGGLLRYSANALTVHDNGQVMGTLNAQPVDDRYGPSRAVAVADPIVVEIDIKPPSKMVYVGPPDVSHRSVTALDLPGLMPVTPTLFPISNQIADKLVLLTGPPTSLRGENTTAWHRYKDLIDLHYLISTCRVDGDLLRQAMHTNWNWNRMDTERPPVPYRVYGQTPLAAPDERQVPWEAEIDALRHRWPQLRAYPHFSAMVDTVSHFTAELSTAEGSHWRPGQGWESDPAAARAAQRALYAREDRERSARTQSTSMPPPHAAGPQHRGGPDRTRGQGSVRRER